MTTNTTKCSSVLVVENSCLSKTENVQEGIPNTTCIQCVTTCNNSDLNFKMFTGFGAFVNNVYIRILHPHTSSIDTKIMIIYLNPKETLFYD